MPAISFVRELFGGGAGLIDEEEIAAGAVIPLIAAELEERPES